MNPVNPWVPLFATALGGALTVVGGIVLHRLAERREVRSKALDARLRRRQRWEEFDEKSLIAFQDQMADFFLTTSKLATSATVLVSNKNKTEYASNSAAFTIAHTEFGVGQIILFSYLSRIHDDETRQFAVDYLAAGLKVYGVTGDLIKSDARTGSPDLTALREANQAMTTAFTTASGRIGDRIRSEIKSEQEKARAEAIAEQLQREQSLGSQTIKARRWISRRFRKTSSDAA